MTQQSCNLPTPQEDEELIPFVTRAMSDSVMKEKYPDRNIRAAHAHTIWKEWCRGGQTTG